MLKFQRTRRKLQMPKSLKVVKPEPVFTWAFKSSRPHGGTIVSYVTQLNQDGSLSCNCPGWIFAKKNQERACKHTKMVEDEAPDIFKMWKDGQTLPILEEETPEVSTAASPKKSAKKGEDSKIKYGRFIALD
jgi:hypothetical protein